MFSLKITFSVFNTFYKSVTLIVDIFIHYFLMFLQEKVQE